MLQLNFSLFLQRLEDFQVIMLAKMFQTEADSFLLPVLLLPRDRLLDQVRSVVSQEREEPDGGPSSRGVWEKEGGARWFERRPTSRSAGEAPEGGGGDGDDDCAG